jgi:hypothetical protein
MAYHRRECFIRPRFASLRDGRSLWQYGAYGNTVPGYCNRVLRSYAQLLKDAVAADFPGYTEIAVSFPNQWELVQQLRPADGPLYVAGLPRLFERSDSERFYGLPGDINRTLTTYRQYKILQPWPQPTLLVQWDVRSGTRMILRPEDLTVELQPIGQAQAWWGDTYGVIWECYFFSTHLRSTWMGELIASWQAVESDIEVGMIFTKAHEPDFPEGEVDYTDFLTILGYSPDPSVDGRWWGKRQ